MEIYIHEERCERCGKATEALKKTEFMLKAMNKEMNLCEACIEDIKNRFTKQNNKLAMYYLKNVNRFVARTSCAICSGRDKEVVHYRFDIEGFIYEMELCNQCFTEIITMYRHFHWELPVKRLSQSREDFCEVSAF